MDSSGIFRGFNQTTGTIKVVCHDGVGNNSLANNIQALLYEGDDDYDHINIYGKQTIKELEELEKNGICIEIMNDDGTTETHHIAITVVEGGDLKWLNSTCGLSTCSHECSCPWCLVSSHEYGTFKSEESAAKMRDTIFMLMMAHAVIPGVLEAGYTCPGCKKVRNEKHQSSHYTYKLYLLQLSTTGALLQTLSTAGIYLSTANVDDLNFIALQRINHHGAEAPGSKKEKKEYAKNHYGHKHNRTPTLSGLSWEKRIPDMLHILLRVVAHLYWHTCQKHCTKADEIDELHIFMKENLGVTVNSKKRLSKNQDQVNIGKRKESFIGAECLLLLEQYPALLDFMYDTQLKGRKPQEKEKARKAWETFDVLWKLTTGCRLPGETNIALFVRLLES